MRIHADPWDAKSKRIGHNFCGTSISSNCPWWDPLNAAKGYNAHVDHVNGAQRGYLRCDVSESAWKSEFRVVTDPYNPKSTVTTDVTIDTRDV